MITFEISNLKHNFCSNLIFSNCKFSLNVIFDYSLNRKKIRIYCENLIHNI